jgi:lactoylglutathione lyase
MKIEHIALWTKDLETMRNFYQRFFNMKCGEKYVNKEKGFASYFLSFESGARIEIMNRMDISSGPAIKGAVHGLTHFAISVGSKENVDKLTELIRKHGIKVLGEPRTTGDGFYESVILDPEGNQIEITE